MPKLSGAHEGALLHGTLLLPHWAAHIRLCCGADGCTVLVSVCWDGTLHKSFSSCSIFNQMCTASGHLWGGKKRFPFVIRGKFVC